ncbi:MAG TPA: MBL fold metallo-hydrolase [Tissierellia bacterium]|jgi:glyoxylase-like metal-dependent hydrolase (beta-lactamase superfamily II)|nr:MBL fold metallo-hydrolase [Tissierellia bacterium]
MLKEIYPSIYQFDIPLRNNPLKALNAYIIKGEESLLIDSGFDTDENMSVVMEALKELDIAPSTLRLFLTHLHSDHTGLASRLEEKGVKILMGRVDATILEDSLKDDSAYWKELEKDAKMQGLAADGLKISDHPGYVYRPKSMVSIQLTEEGDQIQAGPYTFQIVEFPGHTPGLQALYEPEHGLLFSGDHILESITPNITYWGEDFGDALGKYLKSLHKTKNMFVKQVFSSHRQLPEDYLRRIQEIEVHHEHRLAEALEILGKIGKSTVRDITSRLQWDIRARNWDDFPKSQKWFAAGEAHAHLFHLKEKGLIRQTLEDGILYYERI